MFHKLFNSLELLGICQVTETPTCCFHDGRQKGRSEPKPRLLQTSQRARKEPGLESNQSLIPRVAMGSRYRARPSSMRDLDRRIEEAEKQIVEENLDPADKYRAVELKLKNMELYSEDLESQTLRDKTKMADKKQMTALGS